MGSIWYFSNHSIYDGIYDGAKRLDRMQLRSQTSDLWTDAATVVRAVREENESEEKESVERRARCQGPQKGRKIARDCVVPCFECFVAPEVDA